MFDKEEYAKQLFAQGLSTEEVLKKLKEYDQNKNFQKGPAKETAPAGPMTEAQQKAVDTVSVLEDTSSELPETKIDPIKWKDSKPSEKAKMLQKEYGDQFKFDFNDPTDPRTVTVSSANGAEQTFNLAETQAAPGFSSIGAGEYGGGQMSLETVPQSEIQEFEKFFIENASNEDEAYNFVTTGIKPGDYATFISEAQPQASGFSGINVMVQPTMQKADAQQQRELTDVTQGEIQKMYKDPSSYGIVDMPAFYSAGFDAYTEEEKHKNLDLVYQRVKENTGLNIDKDSFVKIYDNVFQRSTQEAAAQIDAEQNSMALSQEVINPDFEKQVSTQIEKDLDYDAAQKRKKDLLVKKREQEKELKNLQARLTKADGDEQVNEIKQNIATVQGNIKNIDANIEKNARVLKMSGKEGFEYETDPQLASQYFSRQTQAAEAYVSGVQSNNPTMTRYEAVQQAYNNRVLQLQLLQNQSTEEKITLDLKPADVQSTVPGQKTKLYSPILSTLRKNGYDVDDSGKAEVSLFNLISLGIKPDDLNGAGIETNEKDVLKYRMFKETYDDDYTNAKAIKRLLDLEEAPEDIKKETGLKNFAQNALISISRDIFGADPETQEKIATLGQGERSRLILDRLNEVAQEENILYNDEIIKFTEKDLEAFERTFMESVTEGGGQMTGILLKIMAIQALSGGVLNATGAADFLATLSKGDKFAKATAHLFKAGIEEANMQLAGFKPTSGAAFYTIGALNKYLSPFRKTMRSLDPLYQKITAGPSGAVAMEFAGITENAYDDLMDNKDFSVAFNELYGDFDETTKRVLVNSMMFGMLQLPHVKKTDFMSTGAKIEAKYELNREITDLEQRLEKAETPEQKQEIQDQINGLVKSVVELNSYIAQETGVADLNPESPTFEADLNRLYVEPINNVLKEKIPDFKGVTLKTGSGEAFRKNNGFENEVDSAFFNRKTNEIFIDTSKGDSVSTLLHESTHAALNAFFEANPEARKTFNTNVADIFSNEVIARTQTGRRVEGLEMQQRLEELYKNENLTEQQKSEEYIANMIELLTNPEFYFTEVAPTFISEIRQEFRRRQDYAGLDATPIPQTAKELVQYFTDLGYRARTGSFDASIFGRLDEIELFEVESGEAISQKQGETVIRTAEKMKGKGVYDALNDVYERSENDLSSTNEFDTEIAKAGAPVIIAAANKRWGSTPKNELRNGQTYQDFVLDLTTLYIDIAKKYDPAKDVNDQGIDKQTSTLFNLRTYALARELGDKGPMARETVDTDLEAMIGRSSGYNYRASESDAMTDHFENIDLSFGKNKKGTVTENGLIVLESSLNLPKEYVENVVQSIEQSGAKIQDLNYKALRSFYDKGETSITDFLDAIGVTRRYEEGAKVGQINKNATTDAMLEWLQVKDNAELLYNILPLSLRLTPSGLSQATGIKKSVLDRYYIKSTERVKSAEGASTAGAYPQVKMPMTKEGVFDHARFLEILMPDGAKKLSGGDKSAINALFSELGVATYNQVYRQAKMAEGKTIQELEVIKDGASDKLFSKSIEKLIDTLNDPNSNYSDKRRAHNLIVADPNVSSELITRVIFATNKADWNKNMTQFNEAYFNQLKQKGYTGERLNDKFIEDYLSAVDFLELRSNTFKQKGLEIYRDNVGTDVSGERAQNLQDLELKTVLSLIPEGQTFADLPRQTQQIIKETLGANQKDFKINGKQTGPAALGKNNVEWFDNYFKITKGDNFKASEQRGTSKQQAYEVSSSRIRDAVFDNTGYARELLRSEQIEDITLREQEANRLAENFKQRLSYKGKTFQETQAERQRLLVDFYKSLANQIIEANPENKLKVLGSITDFLQLQSPRGDGLNRAMIPFDVLTTEISYPKTKGKLAGKLQTAYRIEHFTPVAKGNQMFVKGAKDFIDGKLSETNFLKDLEIDIKYLSQGLITEGVRAELDAGGNTSRKFFNALTEIPKENLMYMLDISGQQNQNLAESLAKQAAEYNVKASEAPAEPTSALEANTISILENQKGYQEARNRNAKTLEQATGEPTSPKLDVNGKVFDEMVAVEANNVEQISTTMKAKSLNRQFNDILEEKTGWKSTRVFSQAEAQSLGQKAGKVRLISSSAQDFEGLNYRILARGKRGEEQQQWFEENLYRPLGQAELSTAAYRRRLFQDFDAAKKELKIKGLQDKVADTGFTKEQAVRVYIWNKQDMKVPGTKKGEVALLSRVVKNDPKLQAFADKLISITKQDGYVEPNEAWAYGSISTDLNQGIRANTRTRFLRQFISNVDEIYSEANLNKLEASFGTAYRKSLEKTLTRIKSGRNRLLTGEVDPDASRILNYINNSTGVIMFLNTRSATLQLTSMTNFVNYTDNNIFKAGAAFANQPQYWKDFVTLFNSDYLRDRRGGNKINIAENEITEAANNSKNKAAGVVTYILSKGFLPTQMADSFAIASGGASFYRNRIKTYEKQGFDTKTAERKAYEDFYELAEKSQQSSKPQRISQQQAGPIGRTVLAFANTPSQYARLMEKAYLDLVNNRGSKRANAGKIAYYGAVQNVMFNFLQQAYFTLLNEEEAVPGTAAERKQQEKQKAKTIEMLNGMADSILRGMGWQGAATSTVKNVALDLYKRSKRDRPEYQDSFMEMLDFSPPVGTKLKKVRNAFMAIDKAGGFEKAAKAPLDIDNPYITAGANLTAGVANVPLDRLQAKIQNIQGVMDEQNEEWQRLMMFLGWPDWQLDDKKPRSQQGSTKDNLKLKNIRLPKIKL